MYGTSALTAVTAQNTLGVQEIHPVPAAIVAAQIRSVAEDLAPRAVKSGMLANAEIVATVAAAIRRHQLGAYVLDPVMVATSGDRLLERDAVAAIRDELLPLATIVTPNWPEAALLTRVTEANPRGMAAAARALVQAGAGAALVKGGHLEGDEVVDLFWDGEVERVYRAPRTRTRHTHGTGCTLSAAIAAGLARGVGLGEAVGGGRWGGCGTRSRVRRGWGRGGGRSTTSPRCGEGEDRRSRCPVRGHSPTGRVWELHPLVVRRNHRLRGIGRTLVAAFAWLTVLPFQVAYPTGWLSNIRSLGPA